MTKRRFLQAAAAGGSVAVAGCGSSTNPGSNAAGAGSTNTGTDASGSDATSGGTSSDGETNTFNVLGAGTSGNPHLNSVWGPPNAVTNHGSRFGELIYDSLVEVAIKNQKTIPYMAADWGVDGTTMYVEIDDRWTWHNGDQYTTESIKIPYDIQWAINEHTGNTSAHAQFIDDYTKVSDTRMEFELKDTWNQIWLAEATLNLNSTYFYHPDPWAEWRDRAVNTEPGTEEFETFMTELSEFTPTEQAGVEWLGFGPWKVENMSSSQTELTKYEDHPWADSISVDRIVMKGLQEGVAQSAWLNGELDHWQNFPLPDGVAEQSPSVDRYRTDNIEWELMGMNNGVGRNDRRPTNFRPLRHAIAFALDFQSLADNLGAGWITYPIPQSHISPIEVEQGRYDFSDFVDHASQQQERARTLINDTSDYTGYVYEDGQVYDDEAGEQAHLDLFEASGTAYAPAMRTMRDQLSSFGFDVTLDFVDEATYGQRRSEGEFDLYPDASGLGPTLDRWKIGRMGPESGYRARWAFPSEWVHPEPVGEEELRTPSEELPKVNIDEVMTGLLSNSQSEVTEEAKHLAWAWNQELPAFIAVQKQTYWGVRDPPWQFTTDSISDAKTQALLNDENADWDHIARLGYLQHEDDSVSPVDVTLGP